MTGILGNLYRADRSELEARPAEFFCVRDLSGFSPGADHFHVCRLPPDRIIQIASVTIAVSINGNVAAARVIGVGFAIADDIVPQGLQPTRFLAARWIGGSGSPHLVPPNGVSGLTVALGETREGVFTFPELAHVVLGESGRYVAYVASASIAGNSGWLVSTVTGWALPRGNVA